MKHIFFNEDLHVITLPYDVEKLSKIMRDVIAIYIACGIDTSKAWVFAQSHISTYAELTWLLNCVILIGWLNKMIYR